MTTQKKFLVLVDGSDRGKRTTHYMKTVMPVDRQTRIVLFHVFRQLPEEYRKLDPVLSNYEVEQEKGIRAHLEALKKILVSSGLPRESVATKFQYLKKGVARDILEEAKNNYTMLFLSRRGMGAVKTIILGSTAVELLQSLSSTPIALVGETAPVKKILLAVDHSPPSMKAAEFVAALLGGLGHEICIFHAILGLGAIHFDISGEYSLEIPETDLPDASLEALKSRVAHLVKEIKNKLITAGVAPEKISEKVVSGVYSRSEAIVKEAEGGGYGTIVVGRRGLSKLEAFFLGRVGHKVIHTGKKFTVWVV